jgi:uncharacterized protein YlzI (FlbEa/FlbD family)
MDGTSGSLSPVRYLALKQTHTMIKITNAKGEDIYLNPAFITAVRPDKDETTEVDYFGFSSFVGSNLRCLRTLESVESVVNKINNSK